MDDDEQFDIRCYATSQLESSMVTIYSIPSEMPVPHRLKNLN